MKVSRIPQKVLFQKGDILDPIQKTKKPGDLLVILSMIDYWNIQHVSIF